MKIRLHKGKRKIIKLDKLCTSIKKQLLEEDRDFPIAIVGTEGEGKSTMAEVMARLIDSGYSVERNTFFAPTVEQANNFFLNEAKGSTPIFDEFGDVGYKLDFASSINKFLKKLFMKNRQANMSPILCIPNFLDIDRYYRWRIKLLIFVYKRGRFVAFKPLKFGIFSGDNWQINYNQKVWDQITRGKPVTNPKSFLKLVRRWSIYYGEGVFPKMFKRDEAKYKELKTEYYLKGNKDVDFEDMKIKDSRKTVILKKLISLFTSLGAKQKDLIELTGLSDKTIASYGKYIPIKRNEELFYSIITKAYSQISQKQEGLHNKDYDNSPKRKGNKLHRLVTPDMMPKEGQKQHEEVGGNVNK